MSFRPAVVVSLVVFSMAMHAQEQPWCKEELFAMPNPAPKWSDIKERPDYVEVSKNFEIQQSLRLVISGLEKAIERLEDGGSSAEDAEADGVCLCNCNKDAAYWKDFVQTTLTTETQEALQKAQDEYIASVQAELDETKETLFDAIPEFEEEARKIIEESCTKLASCNGTVDEEAAKAVRTRLDELFGPKLTPENLQGLRDRAKKLRDDAKALLDKVLAQNSALLRKETQDEVRRIFDETKTLYKDVAEAVAALRQVFQDHTVPELVDEVDEALRLRLEELVAEDEKVYAEIETAIGAAAQKRIDAIRTAAESLYATAVDGEAVYDEFREELESGLLDSIASIEGCYGSTKKRDCSIGAGKFCAGTTELALFGDEDLKLPLWLPTEVFKDGKSALRWAFSAIKWLELLKQNFDATQASEAMKNLLAQLKNIDEVLTKINHFADTYTDGFHLGAYSTVRPDLHACVGYAGHGVLAEVFSIGGGDVRGGANYLSANLSRTHRSQFRAGGFALLINGRHLPLAPGVSLNLQMDGFRLWDRDQLFGISAGKSGGWEVHPQDLKDLDFLNLVNEDDLDDVCCTATKTTDCIKCPITASSLIHKGFYEIEYDANNPGLDWPRKDKEWEKDARIDAVFGAGLNLDLKMKTRYWSTTPIPVFPGASITPWLSLDAGAKWVYAANEFRETLRKQINKGLPAEDQIGDDDFERDFHAFQAEDVTEDVGNGANVNPKLGADLDLGIDLSRWFKIGVTANLYLDVKVDASGTGGILDLNRALVDTLAASNPAGNDCRPILAKNEMRVCSNEAFKKKDECANVPEAERKDCIDKSEKTPEGGIYSTGTYMCEEDELLCGEAKGYCVDRTGAIVAHDVTREQCEVATAPPAGRCVAVYVENPNGLGRETVQIEQLLSQAPPRGIDESTRPAELAKAQEAANQFTTENRCTGNGWCYNWKYLGMAEGRHYYGGAFIGVSPAASECPDARDRHGEVIVDESGNAVPSQYVPFRWQPSPPPTPERSFFPYQCIKTYRPAITGYEGPDCNPLEFGYPSACADESKPCSCDPAKPDCPQGKTCVDGACLTLCSSGTACPEGQICDGGVCVMSSKIPFAEQVAWRLRNAAAPQHAVASYGLNRLITSAALGYGVRVGATLRLFKKKKVFSILDLSDARALFAYPLVRHQLGLEAQYQDDCNPIGKVTNHQAGLVKRYPGDGTSQQLLAWCRPEMAADEQNPEPMAGIDEVIAAGIEETFDFGANIGVDFWNRAQFCIDGQPWDQYFASLKADPSKAWPRLRCTYTKNGVAMLLDCSSAAALQSSLALTLGCLDGFGPEKLAANEALVAFLKSKNVEGNWLLKAPYVDVLDVRAIFADDEGTYTADNLDPLFVQQTAGFDLQPWLGGLDRCIGDPPLGRMNQDLLDVDFNLTAADLQSCGGVCCIDGVCEPVTDQGLCKGQFLPVPECTPENGCMPTDTVAPPPRGACMVFGTCQEVASVALCAGGFFHAGKKCIDVPNVCREDRDCPADAWCRPTAEGGSSCVPWQPESKSCGGFIEPSRRERCGPGLTCVTNLDGPVDAGGKCVRVCAPAPLSMAAWWPLDESIGDGSFDVLAQNDGTRINTPDAITGRVGGALRFDGVDDYLEIPDAVDLDFGTGDFSIALWLRMPAQSGVESILDKRADGSGYHLYTYFGRPGLQLADGAYANYTAAQAIDDGQWHHLAVTVDRDRTDGLRWYIDGQPAGSDNPTAHQLSINSTAPLRFGVRTIANDGWWEGDLDEPALFSRALTAAEIESMHRAGGEGLCRCVSDERRLEAWWAFDEDPRFGPHFGDYSDNGNFGQSLNGTRSIDGVAGRALLFDGVDDYAEVASPRVEVGSGDFSLDAWIAFFGVTGTRVIAGKSSDTAGYELLVIDGRIALRLRSGGQTVLFDPGVHLTGQRWHHVAVTVRRDAKDGVRFYLDGVERGTRGDATLLPGSLANTVPFRIAAGSATVIPDAFWRGRIDELAVHGRVLAPLEIARLFRALTYGRCTPARPLAPPVVKDPLRPPVDEVPIPRGRDRKAP